MCQTLVNTEVILITTNCCHYGLPFQFILCAKSCVFINFLSYAKYVLQLTPLVTDYLVI